MPVATDILSPHAIVRLEDDAVVLLDQRRLPAEAVELRLATWQQVADAIREMAVRGAPAIGVAAAYGVALAAARSTAGSLEVLREDVARAAAGLAAARPTAVNLPWAVERMVEESALAHRDPGALRDALRARAEAIHADEVDRCVRIGEHGAGLLRAGAQVLTHCNAGALATGGFGTALGIIRAAHRRDPGLHVWVDETRPLLQGARLTAWELQQEDIAATLITDSTAAWLMAERKVDAVITGADRIARERRHGEQDRHLRPGRPRPRSRPAVLRRRAARRPSTRASRAAARSRSSTAAATRWRRARPRASASTTRPST